MGAKDSNFICPECGSDHFSADDKAVHCHGIVDQLLSVGSNCRFVGPREEHFHAEVPPQLVRARRLFHLLDEDLRRGRQICPKTLAEILDRLDRWR